MKDITIKNKIIEKKMERARKIQEKIVDIFERENVDSIEAYGILTDLCDSLKVYLKQEEDIDIDKWKESAEAIQIAKVKK